MFITIKNTDKNATEYDCIRIAYTNIIVFPKNQKNHEDIFLLAFK